MAAGATDYTDVEVVVMAVVIAVVDEEYVVEGAMDKTHMNLPSGREHLLQRIVHTLHTNGYYSPCNKIIIYNK